MPVVEYTTVSIVAVAVKETLLKPTFYGVPAASNPTSQLSDEHGGYFDVDHTFTPYAGGKGASCGALHGMRQSGIRKGGLDASTESREAAIGDEQKSRAERFRARVAAKGMTLAEFARRAGLTRNVLWGLSQGRPPKPDVAKKIDSILGPDR